MLQHLQASGFTMRYDIPAKRFQFCIDPLAPGFRLTFFSHDTFLQIPLPLYAISALTQSLFIQLFHHVIRNFGINLRRLNLGMAQELLNQIQRHSFLPQDCGYAMPEQMGMNFFGNPRLPCAFLNDLLNPSWGKFSISVDFRKF